MAQVISPNVQKQDDALTTIMKGLTIASQVYGIRSDMAKIEEFQQKASNEKNTSAGNFDRNQQIELSKNFDVSIAPPTGVAYQQATDRGSGSPIYLSLKKDMKPEKVEYTTANGDKKIEFVVPRAGTSFTSHEQDKTPAKIETVDEQGNPITALVPNKPGQTFAQQPKQANKEQFDAALYGKRMETADQILNNLSQQGYDRASNVEGLKAFVLPEAFKSSELKQQEQAERNFINAALRRESGAAISEAEFTNARQQYFPRAGDTPEVLAQKSQNRSQAIEGMRAASGNAWDKLQSVAITPPKKDTSDQAIAAPQSGPSALDLLRIKAAKGDKKAQEYLKNNGGG